MNTFFPTLQLFFASGRSCTVDGGQVSGARIGLDPPLRFRLTDITHEEDGRLIKSTLPEKLTGPSPAISILEATIARRTSTAVKHKAVDAARVPSPTSPGSSIVREDHVVVGLRLKGMKDMAYIWARTATLAASAGCKTWGDARLAGLRDDVPVPFFGFPEKRVKRGGEVTIVESTSMIRIKRQRRS